MRALARKLWANRARLAIDGPDWLLDGSVVLFALWTLCAHLTVITHGTGTRLFATFGLALVAALALFGYAVRRAPAGARARPIDDASDEPLTAAPLWLLIAGLAGAASAILDWNLLQNELYFWLHSVAFLLVSAALLLREPVPLGAALPVKPSVHQGAILWGLAAIGAVLAALMNRPNNDDILYLNIAATVADHPEYELYARDSLHGEGMTLLRAYLVHSIELFGGFLAWLTNASALRIMHLRLGPFAGALTALSLARLFRIIEPRRWLWLVAIVVCWYLLDGAAQRTLAAHGFIRLFQGKAMLVTVVLPLIASNAMAFVLRPSWWRWVNLAASVIAGIGMSSTGLWLTLIVAFTGLCVPLRFCRSYWSALWRGLCALSYPLALALWMRSQMRALIPDAVASAATVARTFADAAEAAHELNREVSTLASGAAAHLYLGLLLLAWPLARSPLARRYLLLFTLGGLGVLLNPFLCQLIAKNLTGSATYSRGLWYMPVAAALATCAAAALPTGSNRLAKAAGVLLTAAALCWFGATYPELSTFRFIELPARLKVNPEGYKVSRFLAKAIDDDQSAVLAPVAVSLTLPMVQHSPFVIMTKPKFFDQGAYARFALRRLVDREGPAMWGAPSRSFVAALEHYRIRGVVLSLGAEQTPGMLPTLIWAGFHEARRFPSFPVWIRDRPWSVAPGATPLAN